MIIIRIGRRSAKVAIAILAAAFLGFCLFYYIPENRLENMAAYLSDSSRKDVEIFDISGGRVIKRILINPAIKGEAEAALESITGMYAKVNAFPAKGYVIRVPVEPSLSVRNQWLEGCGINTVDEAFVIFAEEESPYLLVLDRQDRPLFFNFSSTTEELLDILQRSLPEEMQKE